MAFECEEWDRVKALIVQSIGALDAVPPGEDVRVLNHRIALNNVLEENFGDDPLSQLTDFDQLPESEITPTIPIPEVPTLSDFGIPEEPEFEAIEDALFEDIELNVLPEFGAEIEGFADGFDFGPGFET